GRWKDFGPCYTRGIIEGNGNPPGNDMWITYSMNKEDMWVSRIPLPIRFSVEGNVEDDFNAMEAGGAVTDWNTYSPKWCPVEVSEFPSVTNKSLLLQDKDPYDYARAIRVFEETKKAEIEVKVLPKQTENGLLEIDVTDQYGNRPVRIRFDADGKIKAVNGSKEIAIQSYNPDQWYNLKLTVDARPSGSYSLSVNGMGVLNNAQLAEDVQSVERVSFRTGPYRNEPTRQTPNQDPASPLAGADLPVPLAEFYLDDLIIKPKL
ncbi:MAG: hypothetical protein NTV01_11255, partial [Bacteroidia bacterium]|nr:hypothetical protein [Bacteroidia bacterium]